jgi:hypothetical protein
MNISSRTVEALRQHGWDSIRVFDKWEVPVYASALKPPPYALSPMPQALICKKQQSGTPNTTNSPSKTFLGPEELGSRGAEERGLPAPLHPSSHAQKGRVGGGGGEWG